MASLHEDECELLAAGNNSARNVRRDEPETAQTSFTNKVVKRSIAVIAVGLLLACVVIAAGGHLQAVHSDIQSSGGHAIEHTQQLYNPGEQQCVDMTSARVANTMGGVVGRCQCTCEWAHRGGLSPSGCAARNDGSCCHACCCGDQSYREANTIAATRYNCLEDYSDWRRAWSQKKRDYCCQAHGRGCGHGEMNLMQSTRHYNDDRYYHDDRYRSSNRYGAIRYDDHAGYDCEAGYSNWRDGWSYEKKDFCCERYDRGCEYTYLKYMIGALVVAAIVVGAVMFIRNQQK